MIEEITLPHDTAIKAIMLNMQEGLGAIRCIMQTGAEADLERAYYFIKLGDVCKTIGFYLSFVDHDMINREEFKALESWSNSVDMAKNRYMGAYEKALQKRHDVHVTEQ